jgi:hypothetical protein
VASHSDDPMFDPQSDVCGFFCSSLGNLHVPSTFHGLEPILNSRSPMLTVIFRTITGGKGICLIGAHTSEMDSRPAYG